MCVCVFVECGCKEVRVDVGCGSHGREGGREGGREEVEQCMHMSIVANFLIKKKKKKQDRKPHPYHAHFMFMYCNVVLANVI